MTNYDILKEYEAHKEPLPSYEEWHKVKDLGLRTDYTDHIEKWEDCARLTKQLAIAKKALKRYEDKQNWDIRGVSFMKYNKGFTIAHKALKEMEGVK